MTGKQLNTDCNNSKHNCTTRTFAEMSGRGARGRDRSPHGGDRRPDDRSFGRDNDRGGPRGRGGGGRREDRSRSPPRRDGEHTLH